MPCIQVQSRGVERVTDTLVRRRIGGDAGRLLLQVLGIGEKDHSFRPSQHGAVDQMGESAQLIGYR